MKIALPPDALIISRVSLSSTVSTMATLAPRSANVIAVALPIPNDAPVTIAVLF